MPAEVVPPDIRTRAALLEALRSARPEWSATASSADAQHSRRQLAEFMHEREAAGHGTEAQALGSLVDLVLSSSLTEPRAALHLLFALRDSGLVRPTSRALSEVLRRAAPSVDAGGGGSSRPPANAFYPSALVPRFAIIADHAEAQPLVRICPHREDQLRSNAVGWAHADTALWARLSSPPQPSTLTPGPTPAVGAPTRQAGGGRLLGALGTSSAPTGFRPCDAELSADRATAHPNPADAEGSPRPRPRQGGRVMGARGGGHGSGSTTGERRQLAWALPTSPPPLGLKPPPLPTSSTATPSAPAEVRSAAAEARARCPGYLTEGGGHGGVFAWWLECHRGRRAAGGAPVDEAVLAAHMLEALAGRASSSFPDSSNFSRGGGDRGNGGRGDGGRGGDEVGDETTVSYGSLVSAPGIHLAELSAATTASAMSQIAETGTRAARLCRLADALTADEKARARGPHSASTLPLACIQCTRRAFSAVMHPWSRCGAGASGSLSFASAVSTLSIALTGALSLTDPNPSPSPNPNPSPDPDPDPDPDQVHGSMAFAFGRVLSRLIRRQQRALASLADVIALRHLEQVDARSQQQREHAAWVGGPLPNLGGASLCAPSASSAPSAHSSPRPAMTVLAVLAHTTRLRQEQRGLYQLCFVALPHAAASSAATAASCGPSPLDAANLAHTSPPRGPASASADTALPGGFPVGVRLLDALYTELRVRGIRRLHLWRLFHATAAPWLLWLRKALFRGSTLDPRGEFTWASRRRVGGRAVALPAFLRPLAPTIEECVHSLQLIHTSERFRKEEIGYPGRTPPFFTLACTERHLPVIHEYWAAHRRRQVRTAPMCMCMCMCMCLEEALHLLTIGLALDAVAVHLVLSPLAVIDGAIAKPLRPQAVLDVGPELAFVHVTVGTPAAERGRQPRHHEVRKHVV